MTKFRLSDHNLMIEKGRHSGMAEEKRFCPFCEDTVESECHFLLVCKLYNRNHLINAGLNVAPDLLNWPINNRFIFLMSHGDRELTNMIAFAIKHWMEYKKDCLELCNLINSLMK